MRSAMVRLAGSLLVELGRLCCCSSMSAKRLPAPVLLDLLDPLAALVIQEMTAMMNKQQREKQVGR